MNHTKFSQLFLCYKKTLFSGLCVINICLFLLACVFVSGMGYGSQVVVLYSSIYYIVILAWAFLYLFFSFNSELPWASCKNSWNTGLLSNLTNTMNLKWNYASYWYKVKGNNVASVSFSRVKVKFPSKGSIKLYLILSSALFWKRNVIMCAFVL